MPSRPLGPRGLAPRHPRALLSEPGVACRLHYVTPRDSPGWRIYSFHHLYSPPGFWSRALNLLPCQASWSVTFRLPLSSDISIRALGSGAVHNGGGGPCPRQLLPFRWQAPCRAEAGPSFILPGGRYGPPPICRQGLSSIPLNGGLSAPVGVGAGRRGQAWARLSTSLPLGSVGSHGDTAVWPWQGPVGRRGGGCCGGKRQISSSARRCPGIGTTVAVSCVHVGKLRTWGGRSRPRLPVRRAARLGSERGSLVCDLHFTTAPWWR